jgi:hypothetical protein
MYEVYTDTLPSVQSIHIFTSDRQEIQVIIPKKFMFDKWMDSSYVFILEDVNFDGYNDIRVLTGLTANVQKQYAYWLYDKKNETFKSDTTLGKYWNVSFNSVEKTVHTWWRIPEDYGHALYRWNKDQLDLIIMEEEKWIADLGFLSTTEVIKGKTISKSKKIKEPRIDIYKHPSIYDLNKQ